MPRGAASIVAITFMFSAIGGATLACGDGSTTPSTDAPGAISTTPPTSQTPTPTAPATPTEVPADALSIPVGSSVGNRAPDFTLTFSDGQTVSLASLQGQESPVVLYFFATW